MSCQSTNKGVIQKLQKNTGVGDERGKKEHKYVQTHACVIDQLRSLHPDGIFVKVGFQ